MNENLPAPVEQPFQRMMAAHSGMNAGAVAIESERAIAEAQGQLILAKRFPRNLNAAYSELMEACKLPAMASIAFYTVPQGGQKVTGASIKLIEQVAQSVGNIEWGHRELSRREAGPGPTEFGRSEVEVVAWDKEKNIRSVRQITILHVIDTKDGPRKLRDQRDIDNKIANVASKQMRGRLQALLPKWLIEAAVEECRKTLEGDNSEPISVRVRKMTQAFAKFGVTTDHLEAYMGHSLNNVLADELVDLTGIYNAIREGAKASEYFQLGDTSAEDTGAALTQRAKANAPQAPQATQAPAEATAPARQPAARAPRAAPQQKVQESESTAPEVKDPPAAKPQEAAPEPTRAQPPAPAPAQQADADDDVF